MTAMLKCDGRECDSGVTYIDEKGFIYCDEHGKRRQSWCRCRKLRPHQLNRLKSGKPVETY